jgi:hypothetical protein
MSLTRKMLKAMGIEEEKIDQIIEAHTETVDSFKDKVNAYKDKAEKYDVVKKELDDLKDGDNDWQKKYEKEHNDFEAYKTDITTKEAKRTKEHAVRELLKGAGVSEKRLDAVLKVTNLDDFELDKDGKIKDADKHTETVKTEWSDFIETTTEKGANTANPPANGGNGVKTKEEIYKMENGRYVLSATERQAELAKLYQSEKGD